MFTLKIQTPEASVVELEVERAVMPCVDGEMGIMTGHAPLLGVVKAGVIRAERAGTKHFLAVADGVLVVEGGKATALVDAGLQAGGEADAEEALSQYKRTGSFRRPAKVIVY